ncbi:MAG: DUF357 domain-containing protein [Methanospirillum sp.]|uniref:DUF357 domain-containing protein n=1 Tax=Methanospirillum sp. TaxID=45200 RepID=UPI00236EB83C|nr:DUF357 domain-containing protein [Methanospirillum sp.]MDD1728542.1 DUF357 domain-containing protein [Methanospirillum sp.]
MIPEEELEQYRTDLTRAYSESSVWNPKETPLGVVTTEIREMISSYLTDALVFYQREDQVNEYASLAYAHGWLDAALFLGFIDGSSPPLLLPDAGIIPCDQHDRLMEKRGRYNQMLGEALDSIELAPESGSPLYVAAIKIREKAERAMIGISQDAGYVQELGRLSYGYGWLDAGLRAGLFRILANPHLFTTETKIE